LIIHLVDPANPRWPQQFESVEKILRELQFEEIPRLVALNKADLVERDTVETIRRQLEQNGAREVVDISAIKADTVQPLLERAGALLARNLMAGAQKNTPQLIESLGYVT